MSSTSSLVVMLMVRFFVSAECNVALLSVLSADLSTSSDSGTYYSIANVGESILFHCVENIPSYGGRAWAGTRGRIC